MGSGHFPVFALPILARMRMEKDRGTAAENIHAVLKDQIHGLELDQRCCQIGAFNLALTAWKIAGLQQLPPLNVACCGMAPVASLKDWVVLASNDQRLQRGMGRIYSLFRNSPVLGSLINPRAGEGDLLIAEFHELRPLLEKAMTRETKDDASHEMAVTASGLVKSAEILASQFTLVATNVPYLGRGKQDQILQDHCEFTYPEAKADLATCFIDRSLGFCTQFGSVALVTPQQWLSQISYKRFRAKLFEKSSIGLVAHLGAGAFETISGEVVNVALFNSTNRTCADDAIFGDLDAADSNDIKLKVKGLVEEPIVLLSQGEIRKSKECAIRRSTSGLKLLEEYVSSFQGIKSGDDGMLCRLFFEFQSISSLEWAFEQGSASSIEPFTGREKVINVRRQAEFARFQGRAAWGRRGIIVNQMGALYTTSYTGEWFDGTVSCLVPHDEKNLNAILAYTLSPVYAEDVRKIENSVAVSNATLAKVPFDLERWERVAKDLFPTGLPEAFSDDPSQWLFNGHPHKSKSPLHVGVARLLCYQWPRQTGSSFPDCPALGPDGLEKHADDDGIVALSPINREEAAAARLRALLKDAYGTEWQDGVTERQLLADAGHGAATLEEWLRDSFFEEHCKLFHHRPFVWHVWDGERDGFHALVNYHRLAAPNGEGARLLQKLAQTYLGDWIARCEADVKNDKPNAHKLLKAAKDLQADLLKILEGETPHDIFVRWKPLHEQSIGWNPDINDGVRLNIRPFLTVRDVGKKGAGILKFKPNIKWEKDRGSEPERLKAQFPWFWSCLPEDKPEHVTDFAGGAEFTGERWNNLHHTLAAKKAARAKFIPKK
jgi:hypothetical protein